MLRWRQKVEGKDFKFCPKFLKDISHTSKFEPSFKEISDAYLDKMRQLGDNLDPLFLQVSEWFDAKKSDKLFTYLHTLPPDLKFFLEVRHQSWFANEQLFDQLRAMKIGAAINDTPAERKAVHMQLTTPFTFIRFQAIGGHPSDKPRIDAWANRLREWFEGGLQEAYFFIHVYNQPNHLR